ncbi:hypothetical protein A2U01_0103592, partial [Trifolium medium]|nr:hypothetical protein [Trifolium medium]
MAPMLMAGSSRSVSFSPTITLLKKNVSPSPPFTLTELPYLGTNGCIETVKSFLGISSC